MGPWDGPLTWNPSVPILYHLRIKAHTSNATVTRRKRRRAQIRGPCFESTIKDMLFVLMRLQCNALKDPVLILRVSTVVSNPSHAQLQSSDTKVHLLPQNREFRLSSPITLGILAKRSVPEACSTSVGCFHKLGVLLVAVLIIQQDPYCSGSIRGPMAFGNSHLDWKDRWLLLTAALGLNGSKPDPAKACGSLSRHQSGQWTECVRLKKHMPNTQGAQQPARTYCRGLVSHNFLCDGCLRHHLRPRDDASRNTAVII